MKKLFSSLLIALFVFAFATQGWAEFSKTASTGTQYTDSQVFLSCYYAAADANMGTLTANSVCILATGSTLASTNSTMGIYVTTTAQQYSENVFGVADADIASGSVGKICIRGAHLVDIDDATTNSNIPNGRLLAQGAEHGKANQFLTRGGLNVVITGGILGIKMGDTADGTNNAWVYINPQPVMR